MQGKEATSSKSSFAIKALSSNPQRGPATPLYVSNEGLYAMAVSPDGKHLATASKDGITRVFELSTAQLCGGFKVGTQDTIHLTDVMPDQMHLYIYCHAFPPNQRT